MRAFPIAPALAVVASLVAAAAANGAPPAPPPSKDRNCQNTVPFPRWIEAFKKEAEADGVKAATIQASIGGMAPDLSIISRDRKQGFFTQTFLDFYGKLATKSR